MVNQKSILAEIDSLEKNLEIMFDEKVNNSYNYKFMMEQIEKRMEEVLKKVKVLVKENELDEISFIDFKRSATRSILQAGMKRGEYEWANSFEKKFMVN